MPEMDLSNKKLRALMQEVRVTKKEQAMLDLLAEAAICNFLVPVDGSEKISFHALQGPDGKAYLVVYGDSDTFLEDFAANRNQRTAVASFPDLIEAVLNDSLKLDGFILNPGHEEILFGKDMLKLIKEQLPQNKSENNTTEVNSSEVVPSADDIKIGDSNRYPVDLREKVTEFGKNHSEIVKIFLRLYQKNPNSSQEEKEMGWLFVIAFNSVCSGELQKKIFSEFDIMAADYVDSMPYMIISSATDLAKSAMENAEPVYSRTDV
ncbi:MAG: enhanced serine sensitivity protein SseB C-terminal domain-containing protein [Clostridia bacterium]|nr:enhanced serine sensitivity protein SseB C-terminal domain-containing protein [Clostridia bacterium]